MPEFKDKDSLDRKRCYKHMFLFETVKYAVSFSRPFSADTSCHIKICKIHIYLNLGKMALWIKSSS